MPNKTQEVFELVNDVLRAMPEPYGEDIIEEVCLAIENRPDWHRRYDQLADELGKDVTNCWIGKYTKQGVGAESLKPVKSSRCTIIRFYTKLRASH